MIYCYTPNVIITPGPHVNNKGADQTAHTQVGIVICYHRILKRFFVQVPGEMQKIEGEAHLVKEMLLYTAGRSLLVPI